MATSGLGAVTPSVPFGSFSPTDSLARLADAQVTIGDKPDQVTFAGLAPGFLGLYQINAVVPPDVQPGDAVPVVITVGGQSIPQVTIAVR
jgi:adhesin/invasin